MDDLLQLEKQALSEIDSTDDLQALDQIRILYLGKKGKLTHFLKKIGSLDSVERPKAGEKINRIKNAIQSAVDRRHDALQTANLDMLLDQYQLVDPSLPGCGFTRAGLHPVTATQQRIENLFQQAGFEVVDGPEIEDDYHNFTALNIAENHPARAMHDTFYVNNKQLLLRTHTSSVQIRVMKTHQPPFRCIAPGRVYRCDSDPTHTPMFHQVEGLWIDEQVCFADLKGLVMHFLQCFFNQDLEIRFRPSYFPFTEPSAEVDIKGKDKNWLEVMGCGVVHPQVLRNMNIDPERYNGIAFGMGVERLTMLYHHIDDLRIFFDNDLQFLRQFNREI